MNDSALAADIADELIKDAIGVLRRDERMPRLTTQEWELLFAHVRDAWLGWLPDTLSDLYD